MSKVLIFIAGMCVPSAAFIFSLGGGWSWGGVFLVIVMACTLAVSHEIDH